ncbi:MAG: amidohydrolase, partial [Syntrophomonadaceae bacterium]|nr:amidohydrolase [Syntrophomonadaceae bacterium]
MLFKDITILDENINVQKSMYVGIDGDRIEYIGSSMPAKDYGRIYEGRRRLLMSGFFNSHAHTPMTLMRGYGENLSLHDWLNKRVFPFEAHLTGQDVYYATLLGIAESLRFGIISTTDMYYFCDRMADAFIESGAKANIGRGITCFNDEDLFNLSAYKESKELYEQYNGSGEGRIKIDMSLHAEYTSTPKIVGQLAEFTNSLGAQMHVHVSETRDEHEGCKERHQGRTPVRYLSDLGLLDNKTTAAHCVYVEGEDYDILKEKEVTVASNPISNHKLASGVCNVPKLMGKGINVAIGTDSVASNNSLNFIEEMKFFALVHKEKFQDPRLTTTAETLFAATRAGAIGQGREDTGALKKGFKADLIVLDISGPHMHPVHDITNNLVYSASGSDVLLTMIDGRVVYEEGNYPTLDLEKIRFETNCSAERITG